MVITYRDNRRLYKYYLGPVLISNVWSHAKQFRYPDDYTMDKFCKRQGLAGNCNLRHKYKVPVCLFMLKMRFWWEFWLYPNQSLCISLFLFIPICKNTKVYVSSP